MPRPPNVDPLRATIRDLGRQLGQELASAITNGFTEAIEKGGPNALRRGRPAGGGNVAVGGKACKVPGCSRNAVSKGLCSNHYQKAHRLKLDTDGLSSSQLDQLAQDGRALRFKKGGRK